MQIETTREERDAALWQRDKAARSYEERLRAAATCRPWSDEETKALGKAEALSEVLERSQRQYFETIPLVTMSCCPFDGIPLARSCDIFGFDGPWWRSDAVPDDLGTCPHFCVLTGSVDLGDAPLKGGDFDANLGPAVPYVVPRLLRTAGMVAVISRVGLADGAVAHLVSYFAERPPPAEHLTVEWRRNYLHYETAPGQHAWRVPDDAWDFDFEPWIDQGKIRWCPPGSNNETLSASGRCPFVGLAGERHPQVLRGDRLRVIVVEGRPLAM